MEGKGKKEKSKTSGQRDSKLLPFSFDLFPSLDRRMRPIRHQGSLPNIFSPNIQESVNPVGQELASCHRESVALMAYAEEENGLEEISLPPSRDHFLSPRTFANSLPP